MISFNDSGFEEARAPFDEYLEQFCSPFDCGFCVSLFWRARARKHKQSDLKGIEDVRHSDGKELKIELAKWIRDNVKEADRRSLNRFIGRL